MIARLAVLSLLCLPFLVTWLGTRKTTVPDHRRHQRVLPLDALLVPEPHPSDDDQHITFDCGGCNTESSKLLVNQTTIVQTPTGYALVAVCRTIREHSDGRTAPCGRALISAVFDASVAAVFVAQGAVSEHSRLVVFRAELGDADLMDKISRSS